MSAYYLIYAVAITVAATLSYLRLVRGNTAPRSASSFGVPPVPFGQAIVAGGLMMARCRRRPGASQPGPARAAAGPGSRGEPHSGPPQG